MAKTFTHAGQKYVIVGFYRDEGKRTRPITKTVSRAKPRIVSTTSLAEQRRPAPPTRRFTIDPIVERKYYEWQRQNRQRQRPSRLPIGGLQNYYRTRKMAYIEAGGPPDYFDDQFDKVDTAVAADGWHDLDGELQKHNIYVEREDPREQRRMIREAIRKQGDAEEQYEQYLIDIREEQDKDVGRP